MKSILQLALLVCGLCASCRPNPLGAPSSASVDHARERGILVGEYQVPSPSKLERYSVREVWVERHAASKSNWIVVRLDGPHVDTEPRVQVTGLDSMDDYRGIWSERSGPPYELWEAPEPLPNPLVLTRDGNTLTLPIKIKEAQQAGSSNGG
jgi:hypothetical protein